jgi:hypothetical protein
MVVSLAGSAGALLDPQPGNQFLGGKIKDKPVSIARG